LETELIAAVVILCIAVVVLLVLLLTRRQQDHSQSFLLLHQRLGQLEEQVRNGLNEENRAVGEKFESSLKVIGDIKKTIGSLEETNRQVLAIGKDIASLQDLLRPPQVRGGWGELTLRNILEELLPRQNFEEQYRFKNGVVVDAVIKIGERLVPVDSKFPLESFERYIGCEAEDEKRTYYKEFGRSVKAKIDDIASKYILEDEDTFDFALMYIPSENVYYQTILKEDLEVEGKSLAEYALEKRVIIVSPNSIYAYLRVIHLGLRGMQFENNVRKIMDDFSRLNKELEKFEKQFRVLGDHLNDTHNAYGRASRQLDVLGNKLAMAGESAEIKELEDTEQSRTDAG
jgi:DNA recombination protein RmuC